MSFHKQRHIFTLSSVEKFKRRQARDLFEKDPFKIHSYNFRYAERPSFPVPILQQRASQNECETYFYNQDFSNINNTHEARNATDKSLSSLRKFQEYRKRRLLNETGGSCKSFNFAGSSENFSSSNQDPCTSTSSCKSLTNNLSQASRRNDVILEHPTPSTSHRLNNVQPVMAPSSSGIRVDNIQSLGSTCEININITGIKKNSLHENLNIRIETDSLSRNLNIPLTKRPQQINETTSRAKPLNTSSTFVLAKSLSKFPSLRRNDVLKPTNRNRFKKLSSIYSSQGFRRTPKACPANTCERLPSLIPYKSSSLRGNSSSFFKQNVESRKSLIQRVRNNLRVYDSKTTNKSCSNNNLNRSSYKLGYERNKLSNSFANQRFGSRTTTSLRLRSKPKLPLNVNINVYADK